MNTNRQTAVISAITLVIVTLWVIFMILDTASSGAKETFEQALNYAEKQSFLYTINYFNAGLLTLAVSMLFAGLSRIFNQNSVFATSALIFIPVYCLLNLIVYWSQITIVPYLLELKTVQQAADVILLLRLFIHLAPHSLAGFLNTLAYAVLGIPSIIFALVMIQTAGLWRIAGWLLIASAVADFIGFSGLLLQITPLNIGLLAGGGLFWLALFPLTAQLFRES